MIFEPMDIEVALVKARLRINDIARDHTKIEESLMLDALTLALDRYIHMYGPLPREDANKEVKGAETNPTG